MNVILILMDENVKPPPGGNRPKRRRYDASRRQAAAGTTRRTILGAARELFLAQGYAGTSMPAIAAAAGVALDTVYTAVGTKPVLFRELVEEAISGQDHAVPAEERDYVRAIHAEPDPRRKIAIYAHAVRTIAPRLAPLVRGVEGGGPRRAGVGGVVGGDRGAPRGEHATLRRRAGRRGRATARRQR